jgi:hypothetical protein
VSQSDFNKFSADIINAAYDAMSQKIMNDMVNSVFGVNVIPNPRGMYSVKGFMESLAMPDECLPPVETFVGHVPAWRWWKVVQGPHDTIRLGSTGIDDFVWEWGENLATYMGDDEKEPITLENAVGFHAFKEDGITQMGGDVFGRVALYGDVAEHELGYRAEKARILDLWCAPIFWDKMQHIPKVRGTFSFSFEPEIAFAILDQDGKPYRKGESTWLLLETLNALGSSNPSDSQTIRLRLKNSPKAQAYQWTYPNLYPSPFHQTFFYADLPLRVMPDGKYENSCLYAAPEDKKIILPEGKYCPTCGKRICDDEVVVVSHDYPQGDMTIAVLDGTFKLIEKTTHLKCDLRDTQYWHMGVDTAAHDDQIDTIGYPTAALAESYFH